MLFSSVFQDITPVSNRVINNLFSSVTRAEPAEANSWTQCALIHVGLLVEDCQAVNELLERSVRGLFKRGSDRRKKSVVVEYLLAMNKRARSRASVIMNFASQTR